MPQTARILCVRDCHLKELASAFDYQDAIRLLERKEFFVHEQSSDGFFTAFAPSGEGKDHLSTLAYFNVHGHFMDVIYLS